MGHYTSWITPTARNRMQNAIPMDVDYSGLNTQTTLFIIDAIKNNLDVTLNFISKLGTHTKSIDKSSIYWKEVKFEMIADYLKRMKFHPNSVIFSDLEPFFQWYQEKREKAGYTDWSVVIGSIKEGKHGQWGPLGTNRVERSAEIRADGNSILIKVMRAPKDLFADIGKDISDRSAMKNSLVNKIRKEQNLGNTPQLIIYNIFASIKPKDQKEPSKYETLSDIIGISLWIPRVGSDLGNATSFVKSITVRIPECATYDEE